MSSRNIAIQVENLSKCYQIYNAPHDRLKQFIWPQLQKMKGRAPTQFFQEFWALKDVSFKINKGETVGIIGRNGSGKSTILQLICGTLTPSSGSVEINGRVAALLELGSGFNPEFTGRENVYMNATVLGLSNEEIEERFDEIAAFSDIGQFIEQPIKTYSSGMMVRLAFSVAINVNPQILIIDEALAVGDAGFQRKCMRKIEELTNSGTTLLFVSHDIESVKTICTRAIYLNKGCIQKQGRAKDVCIEYERDVFGASSTGDALETAEQDKSSSATIYLDPELLSTDEKKYGDGRAIIDTISITNKYLHPANVISSGSIFIISYNVKFLNTVSKPVFGMMLTTKDGICVFGTNTTKQPLSLKNYQPDDEVKILFNLQNSLGPGTYYLTCGVYSEDGDEGLVYLQRRMDTQLLRSVIDESCTVAGMANLSPQIQSKII